MQLNLTKAMYVLFVWFLRGHYVLGLNFFNNYELISKLCAKKCVIICIYAKFFVPLQQNCVKCAEKMYLKKNRTEYGIK